MAVMCLNEKMHFNSSCYAGHIPGTLSIKDAGEVNLKFSIKVILPKLHKTQPVIHIPFACKFTDY
jgi:hypothetical protein